MLQIVSRCAAPQLHLLHRGICVCYGGQSSTSVSRPTVGRAISRKLREYAAHHAAYSRAARMHAHHVRPTYDPLRGGGECTRPEVEDPPPATVGHVPARQARASRQGMD